MAKIAGRVWFLHKQFALEHAAKSWTHTTSELHLELCFAHSAMSPMHKHWTLNCLSEIKGKFAIAYKDSSLQLLQHNTTSIARFYVHPFQYILFIPILLKKDKRISFAGLEKDR